MKKQYFLPVLLDVLILFVGFSPLILPIRACTIANRGLYDVMSPIVSYRVWLVLVLCLAELVLLVQFSDRMRRRYWWLLILLLVVAFLLVVAVNIAAKVSLGICGLDI